MIYPAQHTSLTALVYNTTMSAKATSRIAFVAATLLAGLLHSVTVAAQDVVTIGTVSGLGTVDVPVYIRDVSGTSLGIDQPPGSRIQSYSLRVNYTPTTAVSSVTFSRAGITTSLTPTFESSPSSSGSITLLGAFQESTNPIPFTLNAASPGNQVAHLLVTIPSTVPPGTVISLTLDSTLTQLSDEAGVTVENTGNAGLALVNGSITVLAPVVPLQVPTLGTWTLLLLAISLGFVALKMLPLGIWRR